MVIILYFFSLEFDVNMSEVSNYSLEVTVISKSGSMMFPRGKLLGKAVIELSNQDLSKAATEWYYNAFLFLQYLGL